MAAAAGPKRTRQTYTRYQTLELEKVGQAQHTLANCQADVESGDSLMNNTDLARVISHLHWVISSHFNICHSAPAYHSPAN